MSSFISFGLISETYKQCFKHIFQVDLRRPLVLIRLSDYGLDSTLIRDFTSDVGG